MRFPLDHTLPALLALVGLGGPAAAGSGSMLPQAPPLEATTERPANPIAAIVQGRSEASALRSESPDENPWPARIEARLLELEGRTIASEPRDQAQPSKTLVSQLDRLMRIASRFADVAVTVRDLRTGAVLFDHHGDTALNPASNHKLLTAIAAVELLGADYRFETRVAIDGDTLYLVGQGDPSLQIDDIDALAQQVATNLERHAIRRIVIDDSAFAEQRFGPGYDEGGLGHSYMAPSGALSLQFNTVEIEVRPTEVGRGVAVSVSPPCAHVEVHQTALTARGGALRVRTAQSGERTRVTVEGHLLAGSATVRLRRRVSDPGQFTGTVFSRALAKAWHASASLPVERGNVPPEATLVATHRSSPLTEVLASALKFSNNFTTEQVLRTLGWRMSGEPGDWDNGGRALERFWAALGQAPDDLEFENASGLSREGRVTSRALVDLLSLTIDADRDAAMLFDSMPVAGREGTLRKRLTKTGGRVRAKTGTLEGASALSGIIADRKGQPRIGFSIMLNGRLHARQSRRIQDRVVLALVEHAH